MRKEIIQELIRMKISDISDYAIMDAKNSLNEYLYISKTHPDGSKAYLLSVLTSEKLGLSNNSHAGYAYRNGGYTNLGNYSMIQIINILVDFYYDTYYQTLTLSGYNNEEEILKKMESEINNIANGSFEFIKSIMLITTLQKAIDKIDGSEIFTKETNTSYENKRDHSSGEKATSTPKPKRYFESIIKIKEPEKVSKIMTNIKGIKDELVRENNHLPIQIINIMLSLEACGYIEMTNIAKLADAYFNSFGYKNNDPIADLNSLKTSFHTQLPKPSSGSRCFPAYIERIKLNE